MKDVIQLLYELKSCTQNWSELLAEEGMYALAMDVRRQYDKIVLAITVLERSGKGCDA